MQQKILPSFALNFLGWPGMSTSENPGQTSDSASCGQRSVGTNGHRWPSHCGRRGPARPRRRSGLGRRAQGSGDPGEGRGWVFASRRNRCLCPAPAGDWHRGAQCPCMSGTPPRFLVEGTASPGSSPSRPGEGGTETPPDFSGKRPRHRHHRNHCLGRLRHVKSSPNS